MSSNLAYTLTKIQFGRITESTFNKNSDQLIEELDEQYPVFVSKKIESVEIKFNHNTNEQSSIKSVVPVVSLVSADKRWGVDITQDHILLHTDSYTSFECFEERVSSLLNAIENTMKIKHLVFIGLRYLNKFDEPNFTKNFKRPEFLQPMLNDFNMAGSNMASRYVDGKFGISLNSGVTVNNTKLPPDLAELSNNLEINNSILDGAWAHLDIDVYSVMKEIIAYNHDDTISTLRGLRKRAKLVYTDIVNDEQ